MVQCRLSGRIKLKGTVPAVRWKHDVQQRHNPGNPFSKTVKLMKMVWLLLNRNDQLFLVRSNLNK
jgi:hypothetical protein